MSSYKMLEIDINGYTTSIFTRYRIFFPFFFLEKDNVGFSIYIYIFVKIVFLSKYEEKKKKKNKKES